MQNEDVRQLGESAGNGRGLIGFARSTAVPGDSFALEKILYTIYTRQWVESDNFDAN